jgi:hypothetical protein
MDLFPAGKYDKYGRRIDKKENELKKFYRLNEDDDGEASSDDDDGEEEQTKAVAKPSKGNAKANTKAQESSSDDDEDGKEEEESDDAEVGDEKMTRLDYLNRMARGELASGSDTSDDSDDSDEDVYMEEDDDDEDKEDIPTGEETTRFAVMNCDWTRIRAVDLFALFQSFAPATGAVKDVTIYPSDFGLEKMVSSLLTRHHLGCSIAHQTLLGLISHRRKKKSNTDHVGSGRIRRRKHQRRARRSRRVTTTRRPTARRKPKKTTATTKTVARTEKLTGTTRKTRWASSRR